MFLQCYLNEPEIISVLNCFLMCNRSQFFWPSKPDEQFNRAVMTKLLWTPFVTKTNKKKLRKPHRPHFSSYLHDLIPHTSTKLVTVLNSSIQVLTAKALNGAFLLITEENTVIDGYGERKKQEITLKWSISLDVFGSLGMCYD